MGSSGRSFSRMSPKVETQGHLQAVLFVVHTIRTNGFAIPSALVDVWLTHKYTLKHTHPADFGVMNVNLRKLSMQPLSNIEHHDAVSRAKNGRRCQNMTDT